MTQQFQTCDYTIASESTDLGQPVSILHRATFTVSAARLDQLPPPTTAEVCFVGRSNSGKSSAINVLANQRRLAFSSKTPGRTRLINLFGIPDPMEPGAFLGFLVDLPGYGYASVAREAREEWADVLGGYLRERQSLAGIVMLIDIRRGVTELDRRLADWIAPTRIPVLALLTKADKLPYGQRLKAIATVKKELADIGALNAMAFSATQRIGLDTATAQIENWISPKVVP
jgi:GTP-binding protein